MKIKQTLYPTFDLRFRDKGYMNGQLDGQKTPFKLQYLGKYWVIGYSESFAKVQPLLVSLHYILNDHLPRQMFTVSPKLCLRKGTS